MRKTKAVYSIIIMGLLVFLVSCAQAGSGGIQADPLNEPPVTVYEKTVSEQSEEPETAEETGAESADDHETVSSDQVSSESVDETEPPNDFRPEVAIPESPKFDASQVPEYTGKVYVNVNGGVPLFEADDLATEPFERYSDLDPLGRCGTALACIGAELMPVQERGPIGDVRPSGWHTQKYDNIPDLYLYNRCHLIGYQLTGENDNEKNLITGTRYLNTEGMLPIENEVADYIRDTGDRVLYRVTPCFEGDNLLCSGVLMEAKSVSANGISRCVYCYNVQPGIEIDYADGTSRKIDAGTENVTESVTGSVAAGSDDRMPAFEDNRMLGTVIPAGTTYVLNTNSRKFHRPECESVGDMKPKNTEFFDGTRDEAIGMGYDPCGRCNP